MSASEVEQGLCEILRETALGGSERAVDVNEPLGEAGLGLDSLALVQFLIALEKSYKVQLPVEFWSVAGERSLRSCAEMVTSLSA